jgi:L-alanine-DL-glutamate epimerase-like enolase superfamily enzyme
LKITHVETYLYRIPPSLPWEDSTHVVSAIEFIEVRIKTDNGLEGIGISYTVGIGGTAVKSLLDDYVVNLLLGRDPVLIEEIWTEINGQLHRCGDGITSFALAAVDIGLWDLLGKFYNQPLYRLLGGAKSKIPAYASGIDFKLDIPDLIEFVTENISKGYSTIKMKIGKEDIAEDIERITKVKEAIGPQIKILTDVNQKWTAYQAIQYGSALDRLELGWIEEPISNTDYEGHAKLRRMIKTPIAVGESLYSKHQFLDYLRIGGVDIVQADVGRVSGITEWMKIAHLADAWQKPMAPHFLMELSVSLLCAVPNGLILENVKGGSLTELGVLETPIVVENGYCVPPSGPGHGIKFNRAILEKYVVIPEKIRELDLRSKK